MTLSYDLLFFSDKKKEVIFKRLSLKALSALQDQEERGGRDNKNNYTNVSLRLYIIIHQYIDAQSHLLHKVSLSPSHPHTHTHTHTQIPHHTHTHTHTLTQSKSGRYELISFLEVEESRLYGVDSCSISNVQWQ